MKLNELPKRQARKEHAIDPTVKPHLSKLDASIAFYCHDVLHQHCSALHMDAPGGDDFVVIRKVENRAYCCTQCLARSVRGKHVLGKKFVVLELIQVLHCDF
jgi:hypothetical protein